MFQIGSKIRLIALKDDLGRDVLINPLAINCIVPELINMKPSDHTVIFVGNTSVRVSREELDRLFAELNKGAKK